MKKYIINVLGKGAECYVHKLTQEQKIKLDEIKTGQGDENPEKVASLLGINDIFDTDEYFLGPYNNSENYSIQVQDENGNTVWETTKDYLFDEVIYRQLYFTEDVLIIEDYSKGDFYTYDLETEEDFNPKKLSIIVTNLSDVCEIISELNYNETSLLDHKECGDYQSKGLNYVMTSNDTE